MAAHFTASDTRKLTVWKIQQKINGETAIFNTYNDKQGRIQCTIK